MHRPGIRFLLATMFVGITATFSLWFAAYGGFESREVMPIPFESNAWRRAEPIARYRTVRRQMIDDLMQRKLLDGLNRTELEQLLGPPTREHKSSAGDDIRWHWKYRLGLERLGRLSLDDEFLAIRFDPENRVAEYFTSLTNHGTTNSNDA